LQKTLKIPSSTELNLTAKTLSLISMKQSLTALRWIEKTPS
jgi:hypothetical protein